MIFITKRTSKLDILKRKYQYLMHKSFKKALIDPKESDLIQEKAFSILDTIKTLERAN